MRIRKRVQLHLTGYTSVEISFLITVYSYYIGLFNGIFPTRYRDCPINEIQDTLENTLAEVP